MFLPTHFPSLVFIVMPLLAWGALAAPVGGALQMVAVLGIAIFSPPTAAARSPSAPGTGLDRWARR